MLAMYRLTPIWIALIAGLICGCESSPPIDVPDAALVRWTGPTDRLAIEKFCGDCHSVPSPSTFPQSDWFKEVRQGYHLYEKSGRDDLVMPDFAATVKYFADAAPKEFEFELAKGQPDATFTMTAVETDSGFSFSGASACVHDVDESTGNESLYVADFTEGNLWSLTSNPKLSNLGPPKNASPASPSWKASLIGTVAHPSKLVPTDFDRDGLQDLLVADLGTLNPDIEWEATVWLFSGQSDGTFSREPLAMGLSRVSSVSVFDFENDGDQDLVVCDFGLHFRGGIYLLKNEGKKDGRFEFEKICLDDRPGAIDSHIADFNDDGLLDIATLVSQQYEAIDIHFQKDDGTFLRQMVYQADDPSYGSSSLSALDIDGDVDLDFLVTHGDTFDDGLPKPYHGIHLIRNESTIEGSRFIDVPLTTMPGAYAVQTGDFDGDGDQDIAATALLNQDKIESYPLGTFSGLIWLEQVETNQFRRHNLVADDCYSVSLCAFDWDHDGDLDLILPSSREHGGGSNDISVFVNQTLQ